jgi:hypothetical protein
MNGSLTPLFLCFREKNREKITDIRNETDIIFMILEGVVRNIKMYPAT